MHDQWPPRYLTYPALWSAPRRASLKMLGTDFSRGSYQFQIADISLYSNHYLFAGSKISGHKWQPQILSIFWCPKVFYASNPSEAWCWCAKIIYLIISGGSSCHVRSKIMSRLSYELLMLSLKSYFGVYFPSSQLWEKHLNNHHLQLAPSAQWSCILFSISFILSGDGITSVRPQWLTMENYHVLELIGEGSFGKVYKGRKKFSGQVRG